MEMHTPMEEQRDPLSKFFTFFLRLYFFDNSMSQYSHNSFRSLEKMGGGEKKETFFFEQ